MAAVLSTAGTDHAGSAPDHADATGQRRLRHGGPYPTVPRPRAGSGLESASTASGRTAGRGRRHDPLRRIAARSGPLVPPRGTSWRTAGWSVPVNKRGGRRGDRAKGGAGWPKDGNEATAAVNKRTYG